MTSNIDVLMSVYTYVRCTVRTLRGRDFMNTLGRLEQMLMDGKITEDEYKEKKTIYIETLLDLYCQDIITKEELYEKLNK